MKFSRSTGAFGEWPNAVGGWLDETTEMESIGRDRKPPPAFFSGIRNSRRSFSCATFLEVVMVVAKSVRCASHMLPNSKKIYVGSEI